MGFRTPRKRRYLPCLVAILGTGLLGTGGCRAAREAPPPPPPPVVTVVRPVSYPVLGYYEYNGYLEPVESVQVKARVRGILTEVKLTEGKDIKEGDEVKEGELLFRIDRREYDVAVKRAEADLLKAAAELKKAKAEEERSKRTYESRASSLEEYQQRVAARETAEAILKQTEAMLEGARIELGYTEIKAPISGQISRTLVTRGNLVGQGEATLLTTIVKIEELFVYFDIPERDLIEYQKSLQANTVQQTPTSQTMLVEIGVETEAGFPHRGTIDFRENRVDTGTGTVRIRGRLKNPLVPPGNARLLYPGLFARVRVPNGVVRPLLTIPEDALMTGQEGRFVYVVGADNMVQKRTVTLGPQVWKATPADEGKPSPWNMSKDKPTTGTPTKPQPLAAMIAIEKGLAPGDRVIVNGLTKARPGAPVAPDDWQVVAPAQPAP